MNTSSEMPHHAGVVCILLMHGHCIPTSSLHGLHTNPASMCIPSGWLHRNSLVLKVFQLLYLVPWLGISVLYSWLDIPCKVSLFIWEVFTLYPLPIDRLIHSNKNLHVTVGHNLERQNVTGGNLGTSTFVYLATIAMILFLSNVTGSFVRLNRTNPFFTSNHNYKNIPDICLSFSSQVLFLIKMLMYTHFGGVMVLERCMFCTLVKPLTILYDP